MSVIRRCNEASAAQGRLRQIDATLFARRDEVEEAWKFIDPIEHAWHDSPAPPPMAEYTAGTWGPSEADDLLARDGNQWRRL